MAYPALKPLARLHSVCRSSTCRIKECAKWILAQWKSGYGSVWVKLPKKPWSRFFVPCQSLPLPDGSWCWNSCLMDLGGGPNKRNHATQTANFTWWSIIPFPIFSRRKIRCWKSMVNFNHKREWCQCLHSMSEWNPPVIFMVPSGQTRWSFSQKTSPC